MSPSGDPQMNLRHQKIGFVRCSFVTHKDRVELVRVGKVAGRDTLTRGLGQVLWIHVESHRRSDSSLTKQSVTNKALRFAEIPSWVHGHVSRQIEMSCAATG